MQDKNKLGWGLGKLARRNCKQLFAGNHEQHDPTHSVATLVLWLGHHRMGAGGTGGEGTRGLWLGGFTPLQYALHSILSGVLLWPGLSVFSLPSVKWSMTHFKFLPWNFQAENIDYGSKGPKIRFIYWVHGVLEICSPNVRTLETCREIIQLDVKENMTLIT